MSTWHGGKGSTPRKGSDQKQYEDNWEKIFGKKQEQQPQVDLEKQKEQAQDKKNG